jgi:hypothetical protein
MALCHQTAIVAFEIGEMAMQKRWSRPQIATAVGAFVLSIALGGGTAIAQEKEGPWVSDAAAVAARDKQAPQPDHRGWRCVSHAAPRLPGAISK